MCGVTVKQQHLTQHTETALYAPIVQGCCGKMQSFHLRNKGNFVDKLGPSDAEHAAHFRKAVSNGERGKEYLAWREGVCDDVHKDTGLIDQLVCSYLFENSA
jgi:hypothetical protein